MERKIKLLRQQTFERDAHRAGWNNAQSLIGEHLTKENGVIYDDVVEYTYLWGKARNPPNEPWIGTIHNPTSIPSPLCSEFSVPCLFWRPEFLKSLKYCKGLFTLSHDLKTKVEYLLYLLKDYHSGVKVNNLLLPSDFQCKTWNIDKFRQKRDLVYLGWWVRNFVPFHFFQTRFNKKALISNTNGALDSYILDQKAATKMNSFNHFRKTSPIEILPWLNNEQYDELLSSSIVYINLHDTSANNAIVECIIRGTPILANPLPAVIEYLGADYPLYYLDLKEAEYKSIQPDLLQNASQYLLNLPIREKLTYDSFVKSFSDSDIYMTL